jgi:phospholipid/cholesterol/gamma-HCH transport system substrate-binding protein
MKVKFNKFERVAGVFVLAALVGSFSVTLGVAIQKGWFASKISYQTTLASADGIYNGTIVQIAGLRAGSVKSVELVSNDEVLVEFEIFEKFKNRVREDSYVQIVRPFVIGEKVFDVKVGTSEFAVVKPGQMVPSKSGLDLMDLFSGRKLAPFINTINALAVNLQTLAEAFADNQRTHDFVELFDNLNPLVKNLNSMSKKVVNVTDIATDKQRLHQVLDNLVIITKELNHVLPEMNKELPTLGQDISQLVRNLNELTEEFKKLTPAIGVLAPDLPRVSKRAVEGLDELVVTLKALQKSFLLRGNVRDVKDEESTMQQRWPAAGSQK